MTSRLKKLASVASVLVLGLGVAACSSDDDQPAAGATSSPAAGETTEAPAADGGDLTQASFFSELTAAQTDARTSHVTMEIGAAGQTIKATGDVEVGETVADTAMTMSMDLGSTGMGSMKMILVDGAFYLNFGQMTENKYAKIDLSDTSNPIAAQFSSITEQLDPSKQLDQIDKALTSFEKKGDPETIDGVQAQPYEVVLDTTKIAGMSELSGDAAASVPKTLTYTMFVGPDNLLRRVAADVAGSTITVDYSKWGEPVDVSAPPADQISDMDLSQMGGAA